MYKRFFFLLFLLLIICILFLIFFPMQDESTLHQLFYPQYYKDTFAEEEFPPLINEGQYHRRVKEGYEILKNSNLAILGLAYNLGEEKTHRLMRRLSKLTKKCKDYRIFIYCIDSTDDTYKILSNYAKINPKIILPETKFDKTGLNRIQKMSKLRNILRDEAVSYSKSQKHHFDYAIMQDCDLASALSLDGFAHSLSYLKKDYDVVFANGIINEFMFNFHFPFLGYFYYDSFAFREDPDYPIIGGNKAISKGRGDDPISVKSAFGGAAIYKFFLLKKFRYSEKNKYECEHVSLNKQIYNSGYYLGINPSFLLISGRQGENNHKK
jgi:hypothetical protein